MKFIASRVGSKWGGVEHIGADKRKRGVSRRVSLDLRATREQKERELSHWSMSEQKRREGFCFGREIERGEGALVAYDLESLKLLFFYFLWWFILVF